MGDNMQEEVERIAREAAEGLFGKERVMIKSSPHNIPSGQVASLKLTLHYPEVTITNSEGASHLLRDMFVRLNLTSYSDQQQYIDWQLHGGRTTYTYKEAKAWYAHSHLPSGVTPYINRGFCLGGDPNSPLKRVMEGLLKNPTTLEMWEMALHTISKYIEWESLEGGPHVRIAKIYSQENEGEMVPGIERRREAYRLMRLLPKNVWEYSNGEVKLVKGHLDVAKTFNEHSIFRSLSLNNRPQSELAANLQTSLRRGMTPLLFNGKIFPLRIIPEGEEEPIVGEVTPELIEDYCRIIQEDYLLNFDKKYTYELLKELHREVTEAGVA